MSGWQPIESAPKDGAEIDVWVVWLDSGSGERITDATWGESWLIGEIDGPARAGWINPVGGYDGCEALIDPTDREVTHWMAKPSGPA